MNAPDPLDEKGLAQDTASEEALLRRRAARLAQPREAEERQQLELLVFRLGLERFAVPVSELRHVVTIERVTRVPGASRDLLGLIHVRGELVPLVDTGRLLRSPLESPAPRQALLCRTGGKLALAVDEVLEITRLCPEDLRPVGQESTSGVVAAFLPDHTALMDLTALLASPGFSGSPGE
jgi:purine-binding chemotaxis protein CheW